MKKLLRLILCVACGLALSYSSTTLAETFTVYPEGTALVIEFQNGSLNKAIRKQVSKFRRKFDKAQRKAFGLRRKKDGSILSSPRSQTTRLYFENFFEDCAADVNTNYFLKLLRDHLLEQFPDRPDELDPEEPIAARQRSVSDILEEILGNALVPNHNAPEGDVELDPLRPLTPSQAEAAEYLLGTEQAAHPYDIRGYLGTQDPGGCGL